ncbi:MAG: glycoside hydrolase family 2 TIM barrel-domain containing protein [Eubacteriales bacterium]
MREKVSLDENWLFHLGDIVRKRPAVKGPIYSGAKTVRERWGAASPAYNDAADDYGGGEFNSDRWQRVNLPHDYVIAGEFDRNENNALGYLKYDNAWYRRHFRLEEGDRDRLLTLYFEGVTGQSTIYLNGIPLHHNFCGYTSFEVDITDFAIFGGDNVLAVYIDASHHESWWYEGGGIYRHVWLVKTAKVCADLWGVQLCPRRVRDSVWTVEIHTTVRNTSTEPARVRVMTNLLDRDGIAAGFGGATVEVPAKGSETVSYRATVDHPHLWQVGRGYLYTAETKIIMDGAEIDRVCDRFGFREVVCDPDHGLFVNGEHVIIRGVCGHYDYGLTGKAVPDNIFRYKVKLLAEMGANGYRTSHYPQSEALMDALDEAGFIVLDETRWFTSTPEGVEQLEMLVKRDRNHPSVFFWCVGNEEPLFAEERGHRIVDSLLAVVRRLDPTRPVTAACDRPDRSTVYDNLDVVGINYALNSYDAVHAKFPERALMSTENCATGTTRGWYYDDFPEGGRINAYDHNTNDWFLGRERTWKFLMEREWVMGGYQWIGIEHRGETDWPRLCSQSGAIDLFLQRKEAFYQNRSLWTSAEDQPMLYLIPHWNHMGYEGEVLRVRAYTNCDEVELFVDGECVGRVSVEAYGHAEWTVEYHPGRLEAVAYVNGVEVCRDVRETTGRPVRLKLLADNPEDVTANGQDLAVFTCIALDEKGREVPDASPLVSFMSNGIGRVIGTGSDVADHVPVASPVRKMRAGRISIAVRCGKSAGTLRLYAEAEGLIPARCEVEVR